MPLVVKKFFYLVWGGAGWLVSGVGAMPPYAPLQSKVEADTDCCTWKPFDYNLVYVSTSVHNAAKKQRLLWAGPTNPTTSMSMSPEVGLACKRSHERYCWTAT
jgi:hypothetical protein